MKFSSGLSMRLDGQKSSADSWLQASQGRRRVETENKRPKNDEEYERSLSTNIKFADDIYTMEALFVFLCNKFILSLCITFIYKIYVYSYYLSVLI